MVEKTTQIGFRNRLIESISERYGMPFAEVKRVVETTLDTIVDTLVTEGRVELRDFGVFEVVERKEKETKPIETFKLLKLLYKN